MDSLNLTVTFKQVVEERLLSPPYCDAYSMRRSIAGKPSGTSAVIGPFITSIKGDRGDNWTISIKGLELLSARTKKSFDRNKAIAIATQPAQKWMKEPDPIWWTADEAAKEFGYKNADSFKVSVRNAYGFWQQNRPKLESGEWYRHEKGGEYYYHYECILAFAKTRKAAQEKERSAISKSGSYNVINLADYRPVFEAIAQPQDRFTVDFDQAWRWIGYSTKGHAKVKLEKDFVEGLDYRLTNIRKPVPQGGSVTVHHIMLTVDCFKQFCMMAGTEQGKKVRLYYLEVEKNYKALLSQGGEAMPPQLAAVNQRLEAIEQDVSEIKENVVYVRDHIDRKSKLERENFKLEVKRRVCYLLHKFNNGRCLITGDRILNGANWLDNCDFHHIDGNRNKSRVDNCCPLSRNGHKLYHEDSANPEYNEAIAAWRYWLKQQTEPPQQTTLL